MIPLEMYYSTAYYALMIVIMCMVLGLSTFWFIVYIMNRRSIHSNVSSITFFPTVSVIVPAYNEEKNIANALTKILDSDYPKDKMEILVVDDGSTDSTKAIARKFPVRTVEYGKNMGKIFALNTGIAQAKNDIIITIDADAEPMRNFISRIVQPFADNGVGVVGGVYKAKRMHSMKNPMRYLLEKFQAIEYLGFTLLRKQQEVLDAILVIPGSVAAYRKTALQKVGKFEDDTVIEDYDMTMRMHKAGFKVRCVKNALSYVVAPQTIGALIRERTRWYRGGIQILRKHYDMMFTRIGLVTYIWTMETFGMLLQLVVFSLAAWMIIKQMMLHPLSELLGNFVLWTGNLIALRMGLFDVVLLISMFIALMGVVNMYISIRLTDDRMRKLLLYPLSIVYTSFLFFVFLKSVIQELMGTKSAWVKAEI